MAWDDEARGMQAEIDELREQLDVLEGDAVWQELAELEAERERLRVDLADSSAQIQMDADTIQALQAERDGVNSWASVWAKEVEKAEAERDAARGEVERLRAALEPFAELGGVLAPSREDEEEIAVEVTIGDVRRARAALAGDGSGARGGEVATPRLALADALEGLREMLPYVPEYYRVKWEHQGYVDRASAALSGEGTGARDEVERLRRQIAAIKAITERDSNASLALVEICGHCLAALSGEGSGSCPECHGSGRVLINHGMGESGPEYGPCPSCGEAGRGSGARDAVKEREHGDSGCR